MLFLVTGENIDAGYLLPPAQTFAAIEQAVLPSFQMLAQLEQEGRLKGGLFPGERAGGFVIEAGSFEELDRLMNQLPFFGLVKWTVRPLMPFASAAQQVPEYIRHARGMMSGGQAAGT
jgi:hypothetical protein